RLCSKEGKLLRLHPLRNRRRMLAAAVAGAASVAVVVAAIGPAGANPLTGPSPATAQVSFTAVTTTDNLHSGDTVTFHVDTSGGATLTSVDAKICQTGFATYNALQYGYSDFASATRCVNPSGIDSGGLWSADYRAPGAPLAFSGATTSGNINMKVGT